MQSPSTASILPSRPSANALARMCPTRSMIGPQRNAANVKPAK